MLSSDAKANSHGDLVCLEYLLQNSLSVRLHPDISADKAHLATAYTKAADSLLSVFDKSKRETVSRMARLTDLIAMSAITGTLFCYHHPDCLVEDGDDGRCCEEHRAEGYLAALNIIGAQLGKRLEVSGGSVQFRKFKTLAVHLASVAAVLMCPESGQEAVACFTDAISPLPLQSGKTAELVDVIAAQMANNDYQVSIGAFEETILEFMRRMAEPLLAQTPLVDRFADLFEAAVVVGAGGSSASATESSGTEVQPDLDQLDQPNDQPVGQSNKQPIDQSNDQPIDQSNAKDQIQELPRDIIPVIPGEAFRAVLVSDDLLTSIIHKTDPKVSLFLRASDATGSDSTNTNKRQRLTDRHDSAEQVDWATQQQSVELADGEPSTSGEQSTSGEPKLVDAFDKRSAVNPAFRQNQQYTARPTFPKETLNYPKEPLHYLPTAATPPNPHHKRNAMRRPWTTEEVNNLVEGYRRFGPDWRAIQQHYKFAESRTNVDLKDKYRNLLRSGLVG